MADNQLAQALKAAGLTPEEFADIVEVDPKSVYRWLAGGTIPYPRHRRKIARALNKPEHELWPETIKPPDHTEPAESDTASSSPELGPLAEGPWGDLRELEQPAAGSEVTGSWARLSDPSVPHPIALFSQAAVQIEVLDMTATILANHGFTEALIARAQHGCRVRILIGAPQRQLEPLIGNTDLELRTANANIGVPAVIRADDTILLPIPLTGEDWPALIQLQRQIDGGIFDRIASHFQTLWDTAKPITNPGQLNDTPGRPQPDPQSPPQTAPRRWPRQPD